MNLWNWIYISRSRISSAYLESEITEIVEQSRVKNAQLEVTGVLVYDGTYFAQLVQGPETNVRALRVAIESDARHQDVKTVLHNAATERRLPTWSLAYSGKSLVISRAIRRALRDLLIQLQARSMRKALGGGSPCKYPEPRQGFRSGQAAPEVSSHGFTAGYNPYSAILAGRQGRRVQSAD